MIPKDLVLQGALSHISGSGALYGEPLPIVAAVGMVPGLAPMRMN